MTRLRTYTVRNETENMLCLVTRLDFFNCLLSQDSLARTYLAIKVIQAFLCDVFLVRQLGQSRVQGVELSLNEKDVTKSDLRYCPDL